MLDKIFQIVEEHEDESATVGALISRGVPLHTEELQNLAADLWGFFTLSLTGSARMWLNKSGVLEGFDVWRRLQKVLRSRSEVRRHKFLSQIQRPAVAGKLTDVPMALEKWDEALQLIDADPRPVDVD